MTQGGPQNRSAGEGNLLILLGIELRVLAAGNRNAPCTAKNFSNNYETSCDAVKGKVVPVLNELSTTP
jgi:hypothetical protein